MASKRNDSQVSKSGILAEDGELVKADWGGFVNFSLTAEDKKGIKSDGLDPKQWQSALLELVERGYAVTFSWDAYANCPMVMVKGLYEGYANAGKAMSQRHRHLDTAFNAVWWIMEKTTHWGDWELVQESEDAWDW